MQRLILNAVYLLITLLPSFSLAQALARVPAAASENLPQNVSEFLPNASLTEGFEVVQILPASSCSLNIPVFEGTSWVARNNSQPNGTGCWSQGASGLFNAQAGSPRSYAASGLSTTSTSNGTISAWLISPRVHFGPGATLEFWVRKRAATTDFPDRIQVRASIASDFGSPNVGFTAFDVGTFTILLLDINPTLSAGDGSPACAGGITDPPNRIIDRMPRDWCRVRITTGFPASGIGRLAFRYFVTEGGPGGINSDYVGIDTFSFIEGPLSPPSIRLTKRVQLSTGTSNSCQNAGTSVFLPFGGGAIDYCYTAVNTGTRQLITHTVVDAAFPSPLIENFPFILVPDLGTSVTLRATKIVTQSETTKATWSACNQETNCTGAMVASATIAEGTVVAGVAEVSANLFNHWSLGILLMVIGSIGIFALRRSV